MTADARSEENILEAFRVFDRDEDGFISVRIIDVQLLKCQNLFSKVPEFREIMMTLGERMNKAQVDDMVRLK